MALSDQDRDVLEFEKQYWRYEGAKLEAIIHRFGWNSTRYYQRLNMIIDDPAALAEDPVLVNRLRRLREQRGEQRRMRTE